MGRLLTQKIRISTFCVLKINLLSEIRRCGQEVCPLSSPRELCFLTASGRFAPKVPSSDRSAAAWVAWDVSDWIAENYYQERLQKILPIICHVLNSLWRKREKTNLSHIAHHSVGFSSAQHPDYMVISFPAIDLKLCISFPFCPF